MGGRPACRARLVELAGSGHSPHARDPVKVNLLIREFLEALEPGPGAMPKRWTRGRSRRKRALYISSPIGLGHARRDQAIADELRRLHPSLEIDWLAQHPVTTFLAMGLELAAMRIEDLVPPAFGTCSVSAADFLAAAFQHAAFEVHVGFFGQFLG